MHNNSETNILKRLFGGIELNWWKVIVFAVICGVYTGVMAIIPATKDTSFRDITTTFECWILFAILIIVNSASPLDSALKVLVFFLISQPLVYLVQVPFSSMGFGIFRYYPAWFKWTLLTFPMAFVGWYMKKDKWWGLLILTPMLAFLGYHYETYLAEALAFFPDHLLTAIFCAATLIIYPLYIFKDKKIRLAGLIISLLILAGMTFLAVNDSHSRNYTTSLLASGGETAGIDYDDSYTVALADESYGRVWIKYEANIETWMIGAEFTKTGETEVILTAPDGKTYTYDIDIGRSTYNIKRKDTAG